MSSLSEETGRYIPQAGALVIAGDARPAWIREKLPENRGAFWAPNLPSLENWVTY